MATINDALKDLYIACGGDPANLTDNHEVTDYINDLIGVLSGGGGGGGTPEKFDITYYGSSEGFDRTSAEIIEAFEAGKTLRFMVATTAAIGNTNDIVMFLANYGLNSNNDIAELGFVACYDKSNSDIAMTGFRIDLTNTDPVLYYENV